MGGTQRNSIHNRGGELVAPRAGALLASAPSKVGAVMVVAETDGPVLIHHPRGLRAVRLEEARSRASSSVRAGALGQRLRAPSLTAQVDLVGHTAGLLRLGLRL